MSPERASRVMCLLTISDRATLSPKSMPAAALGGVTPFLTVKAALMPSSVKNVLDPSTSGGASAS